jgi:ATP synthase protein I
MTAPRPDPDAPAPAPAAAPAAPAGPGRSGHAANGARLGAAVRTRRDRRARGAHEGERSVGRNLAMIGVLGWTIVLPTLGGLFVGRWLDRSFAAGVFWTLGLLVAGLAAGCALAWQRMQRP